MATGKKTKRVVEAEGIAHIAATFNNTTVTITDSHGNAVAWGSSGKTGFKGSKKSTPFPETAAAEQCARDAHGVRGEPGRGRLQGPGRGREPAVPALAPA